MNLKDLLLIATAGSIVFTADAKRNHDYKQVKMRDVLAEHDQSSTDESPGLEFSFRCFFALAFGLLV